jgi:hypothetical protein
MSETEQRFYDATIKRIDGEGKQTTFVTADGQEKTFPAAHPFWKEGERGVLTLTEGDFRFWAYADQRLRRWPEQDYAGDEAKGYAPFWSWKLDGTEERISCRPHFLPGKNGNYIKDQTEPVEIHVPPEFFELCESRGLTPEQVLRGFIADVCGLQNFVVNPREDGFSSHGSDERMYAEQWFDRAYPSWDGN